MRLLLCLAVALAACGDDDASVDAGDDASMDSEVPTDSATEDAMDAAVECTFPAVQIAGTTETDALANSPARCGAAAYTWSRDAALGTVTQLGFGRPVNLAVLTALLESEGVVLDPGPTHPVAIQQYGYMTQDRGNLVEATALVAYPTDLEEDAPVLLFLHGTTGFIEECGASEDLAYQTVAALFAGYGYVTVMPDYIGLGYLDTGDADPHPYLIGEPGAIASLDAVRAAAQLDPSSRGDTCLTPRVGIFGASQGGHLALWTERLAPYYAPELDIVGTVATVPPAAVLAQSEAALSSLQSSTGNISAGLVAMFSWYGHDGALSEVFQSPWDADLPALLTSACELPRDSELPSVLGDFIQSGIVDAATGGTLDEVDPWGCYLAESDLITTSIDRLGEDDDSYGILIVTAEEDDLVDTAIERDAYSTLCGDGLPVEYLECAGASHTEATFWALPESIRFLGARFAGEAFTSTCAAPAASRCEATPEM